MVDQSGNLKQKLRANGGKKPRGTSTLTLSAFEEETSTEFVLLPEVLGYCPRNG
jgi:hypothetical protein